MSRRFEILDTITRQYRRFGTQIVVRLLPPSDNSNNVSHFLACVNYLFRHVLQNLNESDMVGITIQNREYPNVKPIGISFRRKDQLAADAILSLVQKVSQSNARINALDKLIMTYILLGCLWFSSSGRLNAGSGHSQSWPICKQVSWR